MILLSMLFILLGLLMLTKPIVFWTITENWKSNDETEPSDLYIFSTRFGGIIFTILGILGVYIFLFIA